MNIERLEMMRNWYARVCGTAILGVALLLPAVMAHADDDPFLCFSRKDRPEGDEDWSTFCAGDEWGYAVVYVHPTEDQDILDVHVTQHFDCPSGTHMECVMSDDITTGVCFPEGDWIGLESGGFAQQLFLACSCYTPENPCEDAL